MSARVKCGFKRSWCKCKASALYRITVEISERGGDATPRKFRRRSTILRCSRHRNDLPFHGKALKTEPL